MSEKLDCPQCGQDLRLPADAPAQLRAKDEEIAELKDDLIVGLSERNKAEVRVKELEPERDHFKGCCTRAFDEWLKLHPETNPRPDGAVRLVEIMGKAESERDKLRGQVANWRELLLLMNTRAQVVFDGATVQLTDKALADGAGAPEDAVIKAGVEFADAERKKLGPSVGSTRAAERWNRALAALLEATDGMQKA